MSSFGKDLIAAMEEAAAHAQGKGQMACIRMVMVSDAPVARDLRAIYSKKQKSDGSER